MSTSYFVVPVATHNTLVEKAFAHRGFNQKECQAAAQFSAYASWHGIRTHNAIKAIHLDHLFGSEVGGCRPNATIEKKNTRFSACEVWDANFKLGQATAYEAMDAAVALAEKYGVGMVSVDNAFQYLWGGGYVMDVAKKGYIAYTNCTAAVTEVVPHGGKYPTLGTNPHSWGFPTMDAVGFPIVVDWATSVIAMGRVQQFQRENKPLPPKSAVDADGQETTDANRVKALLPFGAHKGYGLSLINELVAAFIGGSLPTIRCRPDPTLENEKQAPCFFFQVIHPEALSTGVFAKGRSQKENIKAVIGDILGHGNEKCLLPGQMEADAARLSEANGGLLFTEAEMTAFAEMASESNVGPWNLGDFKKIEV